MYIMYLSCRSEYSINMKHCHDKVIDPCHVYILCKMRNIGVKSPF